jgi:zinc transporter 1/2/3
MFSAGVMVSAGFCHLLGEAVKTMPAMQFSLATFLCGLGYLITLCADKAATILTGLRSSGSSSGGLDQGVEVIVGVDLAERAVTTPDGRANRPLNNNINHAAAAAAGKERHSFSGNEELALLRTEPSSSSSPTMSSSLGSRQRRDALDNSIVLNRTGSDVAMVSSGGLELRGAAGMAETDLEAAGGGGGNLVGGVVSSSVFELEDGGGSGGLEGHTLLNGGGGGGMSISGGPSRYQPVGTHNYNHHSHHHSHHHGFSGGAAAPVSFITAVLMAVALCFHSLLEGAAMGAQPTIANSLHIFIAIVSHKGLAAYALGSSIAESNVGVKRFWSVALPFTFASPLGIFIGYIISDIAQGVGAAAISALASGTFLYVAFMEVIPRELHSPDRIVEKLGALLLGFGLMSLLAIWA